MKLSKKNKILLLGFIFMLFVSYRFAILNTVTAYKDYRSKSEIIKNENSSAELEKILIQKEKQLDSILLKNYLNSSVSFQNEFLEKLSKYCNSYNLKIIDFNEPHISIANGFEINSYRFTLNGSFNGCLTVLNKIENNPHFGVIKHITFTKNRDYKTNIDYLTVSVILQKNIPIQ